MRTGYRIALGPAAVLAAGLLWTALRPTPVVPGVVLAPSAAPAAQTATEPAQALASARGMPEHLLVGDSYKDVVSRIRARQADGRPLFANDDAFGQARQQQVLFATGVPANEAAASPLADARRLADGREWIRYDLQVLAARAEGDRFVLPMAGNLSQLAEIDSVERVEEQYRWSGRILGPEGGTFTITQAFGDQYAIGAIQTPAGEFLLEAKGGTGWVVQADKEFFLPPDGNDTVSDDGSHLNHKH